MGNKTFEFELETVTPLFLGGADPRGEPELRAASIRGALRFWFRALLGGIIGDDYNGLESLRKAESEIFGSTKVGASRLTVQVLAPDGLAIGSFRVLPHNPNKTFKVRAIKPGEKFTLRVAPRPPHKEVPKVTWAALLFLFLFGGLGRRSRRGFGSLALREVRGEFPFTIPNYSKPEEFPNLLLRIIKEAKEEGATFARFLSITTSSLAQPPRFAIIHDKHTKILFCKHSFESWDLAMKSFWSLLRSGAYRDAPVFGFAGKRGRQASPLHFRILKFNDGYRMLLTAFRVRFHSTQPSWSIMQSFLNECKDKYSGVWVMGGDIGW